MIVRTTADTTLRTKPYDGAYGGMIATISPGVKLDIIETRDTDIGKHGKVWFTGLVTSQGTAQLVRQSPGWIDLKTTEPVTGPQPEPVVMFAATPVSVPRGQSSRLDWNAEGVDGVYLDGAGVAGSGPTAYKIVTPSETTTYTLRVVWSGGTIERKATVTVTPAQPPPVGKATIRTGYHTLGDGTAATEIINAGGQALCSIDNIDAARRMTAAGGVGVIRRWLGDGLPDPWAFGRSIEIYPHARVVGLCEKKGGTPEEIAWHAGWDEAVARELKKRDPTVVYYGGTFSVGGPDYTNPAIVEAMRKYYAPLYNSGLMGLDMHLYAPNFETAFLGSSIEHPGEHVGLNVPPTWWWIERFRFNFTLCDLDPGIQRIGATEWLVDEGGVGGAPAHNYTPAQVVQLWQRTVAMWLCPTVVGGKPYPSQLEWATAFQGADASTADGHWGGFYLGGYTPALKAAGCFNVATRVMTARDLEMSRAVVIEHPRMPYIAPPAEKDYGVLFGEGWQA